MKAKILKLLSTASGYISGEELSNICGVSRTAIWKHIKALKEEGYEIESQSRVGYKLIKRPDTLLKTEVLEGLNTKEWGKEYYFFKEKVDSTNILAKKLASEGKPEGTVVVSEQQLAGKGRLGRTWISPKGKGIWTSLILRPNILPNYAAQITLVIAVGMIRAFKKVLGIEAKIKWPNDILFNKHKVCGILTELSAEMERVNYIIVGIGVNVNQDEEDFPLELRDKATSLKIVLGKNISRVDLLQSMLEEIEKIYEEYLKGDFPKILDEWKDNSLSMGQEVEINMQDKKFEGIVVDIDSYGYLIVRDKNEVNHKVIAGDVLLRKKGGGYA